MDEALKAEPCRRDESWTRSLATARQIALNLLKQDTTEKLGIKNKRKACGRSDRYLFHILGLIKWCSCVCPAVLPVTTDT
jgi:hypothetical protein